MPALAEARCDCQGLVALVNAAGTTSTYAYDPYGVTTTTAGGSAAGQNPYQWAPGSIYDRTTDMLKYGQRWYQPVTGRFTQQDSLTHLNNPQQGNRYAYAGDDPINNTDPSGQDGACFYVGTNSCDLSTAAPISST